MQVQNLIELRKLIGDIISNSSTNKFPVEILFSKGLIFNQFKITIEEQEIESFIDAKGNTWKKVQ